MSSGGPNLRQILSETTHTIKSHPRHFLALSMMFLFPISISMLIYPYLLHPTTIHSHYRQSLSFYSTPNPKKPSTQDQLSPLLYQIIYNIFVSFFSICATASITYSTFNGYNGKPVKFIDSMKSILVSFFPLLATIMVETIIYGLIIFVVSMIIMLFTFTSLLYFKVEFSYNSPSFMVLVIMTTVLLVGVLIYLQRKWYLSYAIVVIESRWGFSPLKRSSYLMEGVKRLAYSMILLFGVFGGLLSFLLLRLLENRDGCYSLKVVLVTIVYTGCLTMFSLYNVVAKTILFIHCKELDEEVCGKYVSLSSKDVDVSYAVKNVV